MNYNEIGKTGMRVSNLSFGASSLGGVFHDIREAEGIKAVYTAVENGMMEKMESTHGIIPENVQRKVCMKAWTDSTLNISI